MNHTNQPHTEKKKIAWGLLILESIAMVMMSRFFGLIGVLGFAITYYLLKNKINKWLAALVGFIVGALATMIVIAIALQSS